MVCWECRAKLYNFLKFRMQAQRAKKLLSRVPSSVQSSQLRVMEVLHASGVKCLSTLTHKYSSPYDTFYIGEDIKKIKINTEDCFSKSEAVLKHKPFVVKVIKQEVMQDVLEVSSSNMGEVEDYMLLPAGDDTECVVETVLPDGDPKSDGYGDYGDDGGDGGDGGEFNTPAQDDDDDDTDSDMTVHGDYLRSGRGRKKIVIEQFTKTNVDLGAVMSNMMKTRDSTRFKNSEFKCDACALYFSSERHFTFHQELHSEERGSLTCPICQRRFDNEGKLQEHTEAHYIRYSCRHCRRTCSNYTQMYYHFKEVHEEIPRPCKECPATFTSNRDLKRHAHEHTRAARPYHAHPRKFACDTCGRLCATRDKLQRHRLQLHEAKAELECHICHKKYKGDFNLKNHIRSVHELKASEAYCAECGLQFRTRGQYKKHLSSGRHVAVDDYRFECDHCGRRFVQKPTLRTHIEQMHLRESRYKCDVCQQSFHAAWVLSKHKRSKHSEKSQHTCNVCQKPFRIYKSLKEHMNIHLGRRPFECKLCDATFVYSAALYNHNNLVHLKKKRTKKYKTLECSLCFIYLFL